MKYNITNAMHCNNDTTQKFYLSSKIQFRKKSFVIKLDKIDRKLSMTLKIM